MNIGIDIDDTISKTTEEIDKFAKIYTENVLKRKFEFKDIETFDPMWAKHLYGWTNEEDKAFWDIYYEKICEDAKPKDGAIEIINKLSKENNIIIITARWDRESGIIAEITKKWIEKYNIQYHKLFMGHLDKKEIVRENKLDLFIDDSIKNCIEISNMGIRTFIMDARINQNIKNEKIERVYSWKEIAEKIKEVN